MLMMLLVFKCVSIFINATQIRFSIKQCALLRGIVTGVASECAHNIQLVREFTEQKY